jgi:hypothetical protein
MPKLNRLSSLGLCLNFALSVGDNAPHLHSRQRNAFFHRLDLFQTLFSLE